MLYLSYQHFTANVSFSSAVLLHSGEQRLDIRWITSNTTFLDMTWTLPIKRGLFVRRNISTLELADSLASEAI
jgi:hypothetical protein